MARILVVDDEEIIRYTLRHMLQKVGHEVFVAENGCVALKIFEELRVDLVITDIIMPEKEGIETIAEIRRRKPELKIIAVSGGGRTMTMNYLETAERFGADCALAKPLRRQDVLDAIDNTLGRAG